MFIDRKQHDYEIAKIQKNFQSFVSLERGLPSNSLRNKKKGHTLNISHLNHIICLNPKESWVEVEPGITFENLCKVTLKLGLVPNVVPEFKTITVGGAIMGAAIESSSHRFGQVSDSCLEYKVLLGNGELIRCSPKEHEDLFYGISGSYGSLGLLTSVKMHLRPASAYVHLNLHHCKEISEAVALLNSPISHDFVEGIVFDPNNIAIIYGDMSSTASRPLFSSNHILSPWYYQEIYQNLKNGVIEKWMPTQDYLFRFDKGAFWMGRFLSSFPTTLRSIFKIGLEKINFQKETQSDPYTSSFLFRLLFGRLFSSKRLYKMWHHIPKNISKKLFFIQDFYAPMGQAEDILGSFIQETEIFPIWLCPVKGTKTEQFLSPHYGKESYLNIGLYGIPKSPIPELTAKLEDEIVRFGGRKMLYSLTYYSKEKFDEVYNQEKYQALRKKYDANNSFYTLYEKITDLNV